MTKASDPVPAATILIVRDGDNGLEVFMVVRHHQIDFASGALVFPGGKIDDGDFLVRDFCRCDSKATDNQVAMMAGAIREAFEECGVLLAREKGGDELINAKRLLELESYRERLHSNEVTFAQFLTDENLELACDVLTHFAHWITPDMMPKRFDTHFYVAHAPSDHVALHDGTESVDSVWISPNDALKGANEGTYTIIFPTRLNVEMLAEGTSVEEVTTQAQNRNIIPVLPWTESNKDGNFICIPEDAGYRVTREKMPARTKS